MRLITSLGILKKSSGVSFLQVHMEDLLEVFWRMEMGSLQPILEHLPAKLEMLWHGMEVRMGVSKLEISCFMSNGSSSLTVTGFSERNSHMARSYAFIVVYAFGSFPNCDKSWLLATSPTDLPAKLEMLWHGMEVRMDPISSIQ